MQCPPTSANCSTESSTVYFFSPDGYPDVELVLEPNANPAAKAFQEAMFKQGIPLAAFEVDDIEAEAFFVGSSVRKTFWGEL
jgi:hypothetical protein